MTTGIVTFLFTDIERLQTGADDPVMVLENRRVGRIAQARQTRGRTLHTLGDQKTAKKESLRVSCSTPPNGRGHVPHVGAG